VRRIFALAAAGLIASLGLLSAQGLQSSSPTGVVTKKKVVTKPAEVCGDESCGGKYGTAVQFLKSPSEAAQQALKEEKLVFVLHVSGLFEDPDFT
jgi:hypothetical protein